MRQSLFDSFADMIETIPVGAVIRTLEREQQMLQQDLALQRPVPIGEAESILNFCRFIDAVREGQPGIAFTMPLPLRHLEFYRKTVERLIAAEHLPYHANAEFDDVIAADCLESMLVPA
jgi:hypothetical protein